MMAAASAPTAERRSPSRRVAAPKLSLTIRNRQRTRAIDTRFFRKVACGLFGELPQVRAVELGLFLVAAPEMTRLNETFLRHAGSTDVITFDYTDQSSRFTHHASRITHHVSCLHGEIVLCIDEAIAAARRFRTTWQSELVRYFVHGVLHLLGHDDQRPAPRRKMKRAEDRLLQALSRGFPLSRLAAPYVNRKSLARSPEPGHVSRVTHHD